MIGKVISEMCERVSTVYYKRRRRGSPDVGGQGTRDPQSLCPDSRCLPRLVGKRGNRQSALMMSLDGTCTVNIVHSMSSETIL